MRFLLSIGRWIGFIIALSLGATAMAIVLVASILQAAAGSIIKLTEDANADVGLPRTR